MAVPYKIEELSPIVGQYYLIEREKVDEIYRNAGYTDQDEEVPNFVKIEGKDYLFTENFVEMNGKEYEIVMVSNGFSWEDILVYDEAFGDE